ncbi:MAG: hypothetical protein BIFFINMI_03178 [Phycisphaerae bacterium]|nr:hypothetical protein [Phycisphaerae bacterium]
MSRTLSDPRASRLPEHIAQRLAQLTRRARLVVLIKGIAYTFCAFVAGMLVVVGLDLFLPMVWPRTATWFTSATRTPLALTVVAVTVAVAWWFLVRPLRHRYSLSAIAMTMEADHPELQERISTTVELALDDSPESFRGSEQMIQAVATAADADSLRINPRRIVSGKRAGRIALAAALVLAVLVGASIRWPDRMLNFGSRFFMPWQDSQAMRRTAVYVDSGWGKVPRLERLVITAHSTGLRADSATLYRTFADGTKDEPRRIDVSAVDADGTVHYQAVIANVDQSFTYRIRANDGMSEAYAVTVVDRPRAGRIELTYDYPEYTGEPARTFENASGQVTGVRHTNVTVRVHTNRELDADSYLVVSDGHESPTTQPDAESSGLSPKASAQARIRLQRVGKLTYQGMFELLENGSYHFDLRSDGLANLITEDRRFGVLVTPDKGPEIRQGTPAGDVKLRPNDRLPIGYEASDDIGIFALAVRYSVDGAAWQKTPIDLAAALADPATQANVVNGRVRSLHAVNYRFDLSKIGQDLSVANQIEYQIEVSDNLPVQFGGPNRALTSRRRIFIDAKIADYDKRLTETLREQFADEVARLDKELRAALADVQGVMGEMKKTPAMDDAQGARTDSAVTHLNTANDLAIAAAGKTEFSNYERMGDRLKEIATAHIVPARDLTAQSRQLAEQADLRLDKLIQSEFHIKQALAMLNEVGKEFTDLIKVEDKVSQLADLTEKQQDLADKLKDEAITDPKQLQDLTKEQMDLLDQVKRQLAEEPKAAEPMFDVAKKAEETLADKIQKVADEQKKLADQTADAQKLADLEKKADELAAKQKALAKEAGEMQKAHAEELKQAQAPADADKPMQQAAGDLDRRDFEEAVKNQEQAADKLGAMKDKTADEAKADQQAARDAEPQGDQKKQAEQLRDMAAKAQELQKKQEQVARDTAAADRQQKQADQQAKADEAAARQASNDLAQKQQAVADKMAQVQKDAEAKLSKDDAAQSKQSDGSPKAHEAADALKKNDPAAARPKADEAAAKAYDQAQKLDQAARAHDNAARQADADAAKAKDDASRQAAKDKAQQERQQANDARQLAQRARQASSEQKQLAAQMDRPAALQKRAQAERQQADEAGKKLADQAKQQQQVAQQADQLQKQMEQAGEQAKQIAQKNDAAKDAADAAARMPSKSDEAAKPQQEAARKLGQMAQELGQVNKEAQAKLAQAAAKDKEAQADRQAAEKAADLQNRQQQLAQEARELGKEFAKAKQELADKQMQDLAKQQQEVAKQAADLAEAVAQQQPDEQGNPQPAKPNENADKAAAEAGKAAEEMQKPDLAQAIPQQEQAAGDLQKLANDLSQQARNQAGVDPKAQQLAAAQAAKAAELAQQQQQLAQQAKNLAEGKPLDNLPLAQEALRQKTEDLGEKAKMVADFLQDVAPEAGKQAQEAARKLAEAVPAAQKQAEQAMNNDDMAQAHKAQEQAEAQAREAKAGFEQAAKDAADQLAQAGEPGQPEQPEPGEPGEAGKSDEPNPMDPLADAAWAQAQAQAALKDAQQAAQASKGEPSMAQQLAQAQAALAAKQAGEQLNQATNQALAQAMSMAGLPSLTPDQIRLFSLALDSRFGSRPGASDQRQLDFKLDTTMAEWNRLHGYIEQEVVQAGTDNVPPAYRELVKRYFRTISRQAGAAGNGQ